MPAKIVQLLDQQRAIVDLAGVQKEISIALLDKANVNDYVIVHVGYALTRLDEQEAQKTLRLFHEMAEEN